MWQCGAMDPLTLFLSLPSSAQEGIESGRVIVTMEYIISAAELKDVIRETTHSCFIFDASWHPSWSGRHGSVEWERQHIPSSLFLDIDSLDDSSTGLPHMLPSPDHFAEVMTSHGITATSDIVLYDTSLKGFAAPRAWFTFLLMGHKGRVRILNGGLSAWINSGGEVRETGEVRVDRGAVLAPYSASFLHNLVVDMEAIVANLESKKFLVIDARSEARCTASITEPWKQVYPDLKGGRIPHSKCIPSDLLYEADGTFKTTEAIGKIFADGGVNPGEEGPLVASCGSGVTACILLLGLRMVGYRGQTSLYDGSWTQYGRSENPITTGAL